jgi:hypothetical protein
MPREEEILMLLRENNQMLKQICAYLSTNGRDNPARDFFINLTANLISENMHKK